MRKENQWIEAQQWVLHPEGRISCLQSHPGSEARPMMCKRKKGFQQEENRKSVSGKSTINAKNNPEGWKPKSRKEKADKTKEEPSRKPWRRSQTDWQVWWVSKWGLLKGVAHHWAASSLTKTCGTASLVEEKHVDLANNIQTLKSLAPPGSNVWVRMWLL